MIKFLEKDNQRRVVSLEDLRSASKLSRRPWVGKNQDNLSIYDFICKDYDLQLMIDYSWYAIDYIETGHFEPTQRILDNEREFEKFNFCNLIRKFGFMTYSLLTFYESGCTKEFTFGEIVDFVYHLGIKMDFSEFNPFPYLLNEGKYGITGEDSNMSIKSVLFSLRRMSSRMVKVTDLNPSLEVERLSRFTHMSEDTYIGNPISTLIDIFAIASACYSNTFNPAEEPILDLILRFPDKYYDSMSCMYDITHMEPAGYRSFEAMRDLIIGFADYVKENAFGLDISLTNETLLY